MVSSAYLRLLLFLPAIFIPACASSSPAFLMMYSAYKLNKQGDNIQPWSTPFPIWNQSVVPCPVLTGASWPAYSFLKRQVLPSNPSFMFSYAIMYLPCACIHVTSICLVGEGMSVQKRSSVNLTPSPLAPHSATAWFHHCITWRYNVLNFYL